jgi:carbon storage regulator CsrA
MPDYLTHEIDMRGGQLLDIGPDILVKVFGVNEDGTVKIGIQAPRHIPITRAELACPMCKGFHRFGPCP